MNPVGHTPGPWRIHGARICAGDTDHNRATIALTGPHGAFGMTARQEANAYLIAAAPDLLEAAEAIIEPEMPDKWGYNASYNAMNDAKRERLRQAIARARNGGVA